MNRHGESRDEDEVENDDRTAKARVVDHGWQDASRACSMSLLSITRWLRFFDRLWLLFAKFSTLHRYVERLMDEFGGH